MNRLVLGAVALLGLAPGVAGAQAREIVGRIRAAETGQLVPYARVTILGQVAGVCADGQGEYRIGVPSGGVRIAASAEGYELGLAFLTAADTVADITLEPVRRPDPNSPIVYLDGILVSPSMPSAEPSSNEPLIYIDGIRIGGTQSSCPVRVPGQRGAGS
jgi:hypothetical protein